MDTITYRQVKNGKMVTVTRPMRQSEKRAAQHFPVIAEMHNCGIADSIIAAALGGIFTSDQIRGIRARRGLQGAVSIGKPLKATRKYMVQKAKEIAAKHGYEPV